MSDSKHVVIAPDKFRGSLSAPQAARAIANGVLRARPKADLRLIPVADGGDGTVDAALTAGFEPMPVRVQGPLGDSVDALIAMRADTAVIELALASGLARLHAPASPTTALTASSFGTGQLILAALEAGANRIILGLGGSACTDGGAGLASALGVRFLDRTGAPLAAGGGALLGLAAIDPSGLDPRLAAVEFVLATDVDNPLIGRQGAAHCYGPQKGADAATADLLDSALSCLAEVVGAATGQDVRKLPGAGAAGGIAASAVPLLGAGVGSGSDLLLSMLGLPGVLGGARLAITGEGSLDAQSLHGKAPHGVARLARAHGVPTVAVAGRVMVSEDELAAAGISKSYSIAAIEPDQLRQLRDAAVLLSRLSEQLADEWLP